MGVSIRAGRVQAAGSLRPVALSPRYWEHSAYSTHQIHIPIHIYMNIPSAIAIYMILTSLAMIHLARPWIATNLVFVEDTPQV